MAVNEQIEIAVKQISGKAPAIRALEDYYEGRHDLAFATEKFQNTFGKLFREFALNLMPSVADAVTDKLRVENFSLEEGGDDETVKKLWQIWTSNRMDVRANEVHREAVITGDAYVIVWPDAVTNRPVIYPNRSANCYVKYDDESPGRLEWAAKLWSAGKQRRLNLYYADRVERYEATAGSDTESADAGKFRLMADGVITNPYKTVPVFHFANNGRVGGFGVSEMRDAIPIQKALNKSVLDMLVAMEFAAYRQRWASGIEIELDDQGNPIPPYRSGIERLWITENNEAKFGDFNATDLKQFEEVKTSFKVDIAHATGTPLYYFMVPGGTFPSGEALKKSETRFIDKVRSRQDAFGAVWADVMAFALRIADKTEIDTRLFTDWADPSPVSERETLENLLLKRDIGVDERQLLIEAGYGERDVDAMLDAQANRFNAGELPEPDTVTEES